MRPSTLLPLALLALWAPAAPAALTRQEPPAAAPGTGAPQPRISLAFSGSLREALQRIAEAGGLNLVVTGELEQDAEVHLKDVSATQALRTVAAAHHLHLTEEAGIFTLRPMTPPERQAAGGGRAAGPAQAGERRPGAAPASGRVVARGEPLEVPEGEAVESAVVYGDHLSVRGRVDGDAVAFGGDVEVHGRVEGDVLAFRGDVRLGPEARVGGDVSAFGGQVERAEGARVGGSTQAFGGPDSGGLLAGWLHGARDAVSRPDDTPEALAPGRDGDGSGWLGGFLVRFALFFGLGFLGRMFLPARMKRIGAEMRAQPVRSGLVGLAGLLALVPLTFLLAVTVIGLVPAALLWSLAGVGMVTGYTALASELGARLPLPRGARTQALVLALGLVPLLLLWQVPTVGPLATAAVGLAGLGAVLRTRFGGRGRGLPEPILDGWRR